MRLVAALDGKGLIDLLKGNIFEIVLLFCAMGLLLKSRRQDHKGAATQVFIVFLAILLAGLAVTGKWSDVSSAAVNLVLN